MVMVTEGWANEGCVTTFCKSSKILYHSISILKNIQSAGIVGIRKM